MFAYINMQTLLSLLIFSLFFNEPQHASTQKVNPSKEISLECLAPSLEITMNIVVLSSLTNSCSYVFVTMVHTPTVYASAVIVP